jgi:hypothetical protein
LATAALKTARVFTVKDLQSLKVLQRFREVLEQVLAEHPAWEHRSFEDPKRRLLLGDYLCLLLLALYNPVARSLRALAKASRWPRLQAMFGVGPVSLGSFSEAQHLVNPALLEHLFTEFAQALPDLEALPPKLRGLQWLARDGSLFAALPRMTWALYGGGKVGHVNNAVRLQVSFSLLKDGPVQATITPGKNCERATLLEDLVPGGAYVGDRHFAGSYNFLNLLSRKGCRYVIRHRDYGLEPEVEEELPVSAAEQAAGIQRQAWVRLGRTKRGNLTERLRMIWLVGVSGEAMELLTNLPPEELGAADAALLYKQRWQIEYFFRWVKCLLGCGHWLAESPQGVTTQLYLALIGAVLLQLDLGRRPSKRVWELFQAYLTGWVDADELGPLLATQLAEEAAAAQRRAAKKAKTVR